ncbi:MAG: hypothetical protein VKJ04_03860 [Vampirovibrionales bacterium]|nr:hypothetical protein [Vampirovibrionales bacterium]
MTSAVRSQHKAQQMPGQNQNMIIAGPCAAETPEQIMASLVEAKKRGVDFVRISLWKPRTKPGFDGLKEAGIPLLIQAIEMGLNPGTEILTADQAQAIVDAVLPVLQQEANQERKLMLWIGARNQNHVIQHDIAKVAALANQHCANAACPGGRIVVMAKNQPWASQDHWEGISSHLLSSGINPENVIMCHRGFTASKHDPNPMGLRNLPDSEMAMAIREKTGLKMILDISHIAGCRSTIDPIAQEAAKHAYDGLIIEVHPDPLNAWTDAKQQITWDTLDQLLVDIGYRAKKEAVIKELPLKVVVKEMALA